MIEDLPLATGRYNTDHGVIVITKAKDDPICTRLSMGGKDGSGYYLTFRGDVNEAKRIAYAIIDTLENNPQCKQDFLL